ncbi:MAG TPA: prepilin-type N-terminal cleavage/methylation domain-containing protein [Vicinamibacterales bacterium]|nr:prepilin-type N-terminal cleavage/methylation domain-containing protein [Vicinamibacterales bacterium]
MGASALGSSGISSAASDRAAHRRAAGAAASGRRVAPFTPVAAVAAGCLAPPASSAVGSGAAGSASPTPWERDIAPQVAKPGPGAGVATCGAARLAVDERGFTLVEALAAVAIAVILFAMATPRVQDMVSELRLNQAAREVERELQTARLRAVATNRALRVRSNCPSAGYVRIVEVLGTAADTAADRCSESAYPFPAADNDPITRPNHDGPLRRLYSGVTITTGTLEFRPNGTVFQVDAAGVPQPISTFVTVTLTRQSKTRSITVNGVGKIQLR